MQFAVSGSFSRKDYMRNQDNSELIGYGIAAIIAVVVLYSFWQYIVGALALFGIGYVIREINRNNRNNRR